MGVRKLYEVTVSFTYYVEAESRYYARGYINEAWSDGGPEQTEIREVLYSDHRLTGQWAPECLVYGTEGDVELGDLLAKLPPRPKGGAS